LAGLVGLALVTAYLLGSQGEGVTAPASAATQQPDSQQGQRLVSMVGTGEASAVPDQISFTLSATARRLDLDDALAASSATTRRVLAELGRHGVEKSDVQSTGLSMYPEYEYHAYEPPTLVGYRVTQRATVKVDELAKGGPAIAAAVEVGGNGIRVSGIRLGVGDPDAVMHRARDAAVESATAKAQQYAAATGQSLGDVMSIREVGRSAQSRPQELSSFRTIAAADAMKALPIRAGKDDLQVRIQVVWALK
ncbi:MAG TPA: SIMPL domain-containing protein, partial [Nocardioides sp.]|nr:SIMPL domain-containing protein [Nocardioides sp.]